MAATASRAGRSSSFSRNPSSFTSSSSSLNPQQNYPGIKPAPNGAVFVSSGIPDLDKILGGGFLLGSIVMIMEDADAPHHLLLLRNFMSQGIVHHQPLLFGSPLNEPRAFLGTLPAIYTPSSSSRKEENQKEDENGLKIAWQYKKYLSEQAAHDAKQNFGNDFDLRKPLERHLLSAQQIECVPIQSMPNLEDLRNRCFNFLTSLPRNDGSNAGRIAIQSLCAPHCGYTDMRKAILDPHSMDLKIFFLKDGKFNNKRKMWPFSKKSSSGFSSSATAEQVTEGIDGSNLTAIVTGASSGIGKETARVLALRGVHVLMAVRNVSSGNNVKEEILKEVPNAKIDILELNLSSMTSIRKFAPEFESLHLPLNILINNAGYLGPYALSEDGIELHFATNYLGHFLLTNLLLENMKETSEKSKIEGRIVNVSSEGHRWSYSGGIRFDNINDESGFKTHLAYNQSKLANILHAAELSKHFEKGQVNITANTVHPGAILTTFFRNGGFAKASMNFIANTLGRLVLKTIQQGAATTCYVALNSQVKGVSGKYFSNCNECAPSYKAMDEDLAAKLWDYSMKMTST